MTCRIMESTMTLPTLNYEPRLASVPRWPAALLVFWAMFDILFGGLITCGSLILIGAPEDESRIFGRIGFMIGAAMFVWGWRICSISTGIARGKLESLKTAVRACIAAEIATYTVCGLIYLGFFIREPAWHSAHRLANFGLAALVTLMIPATTTLTRILIRAAWRKAAAEAAPTVSQ
jgi:hypothetical protein